jgi:hypothetical protein
MGHPAFVASVGKTMVDLAQIPQTWIYRPSLTY